MVRLIYRLKGLKKIENVRKKIKSITIERLEKKH